MSSLRKESTGTGQHVLPNGLTGLPQGVVAESRRLAVERIQSQCLSQMGQTLLDATTTQECCTERGLAQWAIGPEQTGFVVVDKRASRAGEHPMKLPAKQRALGVDFRLDIPRRFPRSTFPGTPKGIESQRVRYGIERLGITVAIPIKTCQHLPGLLHGGIRLPEFFKGERQVDTHHHLARVTVPHVAVEGDETVKIWRSPQRLGNSPSHHPMQVVRFSPRSRLQIDVEGRVSTKRGGCQLPDAILQRRQLATAIGQRLRIEQVVALALDLLQMPVPEELERTLRSLGRGGASNRGARLLVFKVIGKKLFKVVFIVVDALVTVAKNLWKFEVACLLQQQCARRNGFKRAAVGLTSNAAVKHDPGARQQFSVVGAKHTGRQDNVPSF